MARSDTGGEQNYQELAMFQFLATYFHETYRNFLCPEKQIRLTDKEEQVLLWAADGKTDEDISDILCISVPTVRYRRNNIFNKLDARADLRRHQSDPPRPDHSARDPSKLSSLIVFPLRK